MGQCAIEEFVRGTICVLMDSFFILLTLLESIGRPTFVLTI